MEEILQGLDDVVRSGKALYTGASSMYAWQFAKMLYLADAMGVSRFASMQNHYNLVYREEEREMIPLCRAEGIGVLPWSPLARGFLAGNRDSNRSGETLRSRTDNFAHKLYYQPSDFAVVDKLSEISERRGERNAQVALAWVLAQPGITSPIVGVTKMQHLEDAIAALDLKLSDSELAELGSVYQPHPVLGHS
jgi:aryl-alcohol dehydrogenase (NADP+)